MFELFPGNYRWSYNALAALAAGGQIGDLDLILPRLRASGGDDAAWHREWAWLAEVLESRAGKSHADGALETAAEHFFLASLYHTMSEHFIPPSEPLRLSSYRKAIGAFENARMLSGASIERIMVPYENATELPAYFVPGYGHDDCGPAVIFLCGLDTTKEISVLRVRDCLARRGISCLAIDTPGVGEALRLGGLPTRHDYEVPVSAAIDYLHTRADVEPEAMGIIGSSLGGYYVARAAAFEPRLAAAVAWGAINDYHEVWQRRVTEGGAVAAAGFQLMFVTGTNSMEAAMDRIRDFRVAPFGDCIRCPFLVVHGSQDRQVPRTDADRMFAAIGSRDKSLMICDGTNAGSAHCQFDNHFPALLAIADWLAEKLGGGRDTDRIQEKTSEGGNGHGQGQ